MEKPKHDSFNNNNSKAEALNYSKTVAGCCDTELIKIEYHNEENQQTSKSIKPKAEEKPNIDLYLISGFLGSGKTTFLKQLLTNMQDKKIGVLVNEFGAIAVDGTLVQKEGMYLVEISNGSIFCSCLKSEFVNSLINFTKLGVDALIIENTGLADPSNMHTLLNELAGRVEREYNYRGAVCIVDAVSFTRHVKVLTPIQNQIISSNFIIINKIDMVNEKTLAEVRDVIKKLNPSAILYETMYSEVPWNFLEANLIDNGYSGQTSNKVWNRPSSYALESDAAITKGQIEQFLNSLPVGLLRSKGFVKIDNEVYLLNATAEQCRLEQYNKTKRDLMERTRIVVILDTTDDYSFELKRIWKSITNTDVNIYE